jgi:hypothetical protein
MNRMPGGREPVEVSSQQNGTCTVNVAHLRQIKLNGAAAIQRLLRVR